MKNSTLNRFLQLLTAIIILFSPTFLVGQKWNYIAQAAEVTISSEILREQRSISICLPDDYPGSLKKYPVLYLLDGETHLHHASGAVDFLTGNNAIPPVIIIAIHNIDRTRDFSPVATDQFPTSGGAAKFLKFLANELIPYIDENYRTTGFNILMGHSFGGTFAAYSLLAKPELFAGYIAISPYLHYANSYIIKEAELKLKRRYATPKYFYMTIGNEPDYLFSLEKFSGFVTGIAGKSIDFEYEKMQAENHGSNPYISLYKGLKYIFSDWMLSNETFGRGLQAIDQHYANAAEKYRMETTTPEAIINLLGYNYLQAREINKAIKVFAENVSRYPDSPNVYDSLGEAYERNNQLKLAQKNYRKAVELGDAQKNQNREIYRENLERITGLLDN